MENTHISRVFVEKDQNARNNSIILGDWMFFCNMPVSLAIVEPLERKTEWFVLTHWCG